MVAAPTDPTASRPGRSGRRTRRRSRRAASRTARGCRFRPCSARLACSSGFPRTGAAGPRPGAVGSGTSLRPPAFDRVELIVDAETGILLRREETFEGQLLTLFELTTVTMSPPEADDPARFAPPAGSRPVRDPEDAPGRSGLGWQVAANAAGLAAGGLGAWLRLAPHLPGHRPAAEASVLAAMPSPQPGPLHPR